MKLYDEFYHKWAVVICIQALEVTLYIVALTAPWLRIRSFFPVWQPAVVY